MANIIIGIHGLSNKPEKSKISEWWEAAIREGLLKTCGIQNADFQIRFCGWNYGNY